ncbi:hypothetical protein J4417_01245 [Candidatus Woesearchaeota archaeon]|nr:hypothetical protein [Candidatus Woesearchaeota archaeon]
MKTIGFKRFLFYGVLLTVPGCELDYQPHEPPACCKDVICPSEVSECFEQCLYDKKGNYSCDYACKPPEDDYPHIIEIDCECRKENFPEKIRGRSNYF